MLECRLVLVLVLVVLIKREWEWQVELRGVCDRPAMPIGCSRVCLQSIDAAWDIGTV